MFVLWKILLKFLQKYWNANITDWHLPFFNQIEELYDFAFLQYLTGSPPANSFAEYALHMCILTATSLQYFVELEIRPNPSIESLQYFFELCWKAKVSYHTISNVALPTYLYYADDFTLSKTLAEASSLGTFH